MAGSGVDQAYVQIGSEGSGSLFVVGDVVNLAGDIALNALVSLGQIDLLQQTTGKEESGAVSSRVVGQANLDSVSGQLLSIGRAHDTVASDGGPNDLADDVLVGEADNKSVSGGIVLVLVLGNQPLAGTVVGLALTPSAVFDLKALVVSPVLNNLDETHLQSSNAANNNK